MANDTLAIPIITPNGTVRLIIYGDNNTTCEAPDAIENGEAQFQLYEGKYYEYELDNKEYTLETSEVVSQSRVSSSTGRIAPNIYVGTLTIGLLLKTTGERTGEVKLEVRSMKTEYRSDYRQMLKDIAEKSIDLIFYHNSIVTQQFTANADKEPQTLYQRFAFLKSIIEGDEFNYGLQKILYAPVTRWSDTTTERDTRSLKRVGNSVMKQLASSGSRIKIPLSNPLSAKLKTIPTTVNVLQKVDSVDTPENRFIKFALSHFLYFLEEIIEKAKDADRLRLEATFLATNIENYLSHSIFKEISNPDTVSLNSPILQRKEGYREILRAWIMFEYAANLAWHGGEDVYSGGKKNIAVLYEYWLFFKLLDVVKETFKVEPKSLKQLISIEGGLSLNLKQGKHFSVKGVYESGTRKLNIQFSYNRTFNGESKYPDGGSWSRPLRPDYTLSIWPVGVTDTQVEEQELITHIHFDAKYRIENFSALIEKGEDLSDEKLEQSKGTYKRADMLKMHTYRDAIRRTSGAYVLYPGSDGTHNIPGFHEIYPVSVRLQSGQIVLMTVRVN